VILSQAYQRARFASYLDPWADPLKGGYQIIQGQIALGTGRLFGVGLGASRQKWSYVPNAHTDFIFAIIGEELGLIGTLVVLAGFAFFVYLGIRIAREAPDRFGFLVAGGITAWIGVQAVINVGAVTAEVVAAVFGLVAAGVAAWTGACTSNIGGWSAGLIGSGA